ncbi:hypothetical protein GCM10018781_02140 [Kitasatospora indigofera]|uniref:Uncharacterized protein n=1 Tax=Kitasatospora indigofera TaxID=67307 RepID=A0A919KJI9_9ACTN|nr:hypothetical protein GCM10018781_02140 [Kitasatospora indigofera]
MGDPVTPKALIRSDACGLLELACAYDDSPLGPPPPRRPLPPTGARRLPGPAGRPAGAHPGPQTPALRQDFEEPRATGNEWRLAPDGRPPLSPIGRPDPIGPGHRVVKALTNRSPSQRYRQLIKALAAYADSLVGVHG